MAKRLIDQTALIEDIEAAAAHGGMGEVVAGTLKRYVKHQPTVDAVEVCYCKDCSWRDGEGDCLNPKCGKSWYGCHVPDEHYCSYGERKGGQAPQKEDV